MDFGDMLSEFTSLKVSALSKTLLINQCVDEVTIGPNAKLSPIRAPSSKSPLISKDTVDLSKTGLRVSPRKRIVENTPFGYQFINTIEKNTKEKVVQSIDEHVKTVEEFNRQQKQRRLEQWREKKELQIKQIQYEEALMLEAIQKVEDDSKLEFARAAARNIQRQTENDQKLKAKADEQHKLQQLLTAYAHIEKEFMATFKEIDSLFKNNQEAKTETVACEPSFKHLCTQFTTVGSRIKTKIFPEQDVQVTKELLTQFKQLKETLKTVIKEHYQKREREATEKVAFLKKREDGERAKHAAQAQQTVPEPTAVATTSTTAVAPTPRVAITTKHEKSVLTHYIQLQTFLQNHQQGYRLLVEDKSLQKFKMNLRKAINTPVNLISAVSSAHLRDKYKQLYTLLAGMPVQTGDSRVNASEHPQGIAYAMDQLAKMFVKQGDLVISSTPEAAFAYATIIVTLWNDFPVFGQLLLAHFYKECPYLVPFIFERQAGQSDQDFYTLLGYQYREGVIESHEKFLKRMAGISKLYFSILIASTRRGTPANPHHLAYGWTWIARVLNQQPHVGVTATLIYTFLEVAGASMQQAYGRQFKKLVFYIHKFYLPLLRQRDSGGPLERLEVLLKKYIEEGAFARPSGMLSKQFW